MAFWSRRSLREAIGTAAAMCILVSCSVVNCSTADESVQHSVHAAAYNETVDMAYFNESAHSTHGVNDSHGVGGHDVERFEVLKFDFTKVSTPFIISFWILIASIAKIGFHFSNKLSSIFPESSLLIVLGIVVGVIFFFSTPGQDYHQMNANVFFYFLLPPIILESGYFMPNRAFFDNIGTILLYAVVGTLFNTITIGFSLWGVSSAGGLSNSRSMELLHCLLFSSLISAVDPVAVLAVFEEIHVNEILHIVVFGESLLNDAVTVVLYHMFEGYSHMGEENIQVIDIVAGAAAFIVVGLGGTVIGVVFGLLAAFITRFTSHVRVIEPIFVFLLAYLSYLTAEMFHFSGIMALTFCGIVMKQYVEFNISEKSQTTVKYFMKMLSSTSETIIFMFLGTSTIVDSHDWDAVFIISTIIFCLVYRAIGVLILTAAANKKRMIKLSYVDQFVMAYGGLRGAVAFALATTLDSKVIGAKNIFVTTTIIVIMFTVFVQGITIKPLVNVLRVKKHEKRQLSMNEQIHERFVDHLMAGVEDITGFHGDNWLRDKFEYYDNKYLKKYLLREKPKTRETEILRVNSKLSLRDAMENMHRPASSANTSLATQLHILNEPSLTKIIRNWSNTSLQDSVCSAGGDPITVASENANGTVIDMQALEATYSKKMADDSKIHHILSDNMIRLRKRWTKRKRHELDDVENHPPFHHTMRLHLRHIISQHQRRQREKRSASMRPVEDASAPRDGGFSSSEFPVATCRSGKNVTFCDLAAIEVSAGTPDVKDMTLKLPMASVEFKLTEEEDDDGIVFKAKDEDFYPDEPPSPTADTHMPPWKHSLHSSSAAGGADDHDSYPMDTFVPGQYAVAHASFTASSTVPLQLTPPGRVSPSLPPTVPSTANLLPWRQVDDSAPEVSHRAQSEVPLLLHAAVAHSALSDSGGESQESVAGYSEAVKAADRRHSGSLPRSLRAESSASTLDSVGTFTGETRGTGSRNSVTHGSLGTLPSSSDSVKEVLPETSPQWTADEPRRPVDSRSTGDPWKREPAEDDDDDKDGDENMPLTRRLKRAKNSYEAISSRFSKEKHEAGDEEEVSFVVTSGSDYDDMDSDCVDV